MVADHQTESYISIQPVCVINLKINNTSWESGFVRFFRVMGPNEAHRGRATRRK